MNKLRVILLTTLAAFLTYFSMYAFRKPYTAGLYEGLELWGVDYKIMLVTLQVIGYALSKIIGIRFISELTPEKRALSVLILVGISWLALLSFAIIPAPLNALALFFNGLPLGLIWGIVFSFVEGRRYTELIAAGLSVSFIISSGVVKTLGRILIDLGISECWMPFVSGSLFVPVLILSVWLLRKTPQPTPEDISLRQPRNPMNARERRKLVRQYFPGLLLITAIYLTLTIFRDIRDNFAVDIWKDLGYLNTPSLLTTSEVIIAFVILIISGSLFLIRNYWRAFTTNLWVLPASGLLILLSTLLFSLQIIHPVLWMILMGFGMYLPYIIYHTMLLERWIAAFSMRANVGFLMYILDSVGYIASIGILVYKNYFNASLSWGHFFKLITLVSAIIIILLGLLNWIWFRNHYKRQFQAH